MYQSIAHLLGDRFAPRRLTERLSKLRRVAAISRAVRSTALGDILRALLIWVAACAIPGFLLGLFPVLPVPLAALFAFLMALSAPFLVSFGVSSAARSAVLLGALLERRSLTAPARTLAEHRAVKIAVLGTVGKTSMVETLRAVLSEGRVVATGPEAHITPSNIATFVKGLAGTEDVIIFELGDDGDEADSLLAAISPDIAILTGLPEGDTTLLRASMEALGEKPLFVNGDDTPLRRAAPRGSILYGRGGALLWKVAGSETSLGGTSVTLRHGARTVTARSRLLGLHHLGSLAVAADIATRLGLSDEDIQRGIGATGPFERRLELRKLDDGVLLIDDSYGTDPKGAAAAVEFLGRLAGRSYVIVGGLAVPESRLHDAHEELGREIAGAGIEKVVLLRNSEGHAVEQGLTRAGFEGELLYAEDLSAAVAAVSDRAIPGDVILLQGGRSSAALLG